MQCLTCHVSVIRMTNCWHNVTHVEQVCVQLPMYADNVALPAFAHCCCSNHRYPLPTKPTAANLQQLGQTDHFTVPALHTMQAVPIIYFIFSSAHCLNYFSAGFYHITTVRRMIKVEDNELRDTDVAESLTWPQVSSKIKIFVQCKQQLAVAECAMMSNNNQLRRNESANCLMTNLCQILWAGVQMKSSPTPWTWFFQAHQCQTGEPVQAQPAITFSAAVSHTFNTQWTSKYAHQPS